MTEHRYHLDNRRGREHKHKCPECGDPRSFRLYIDTQTGRYIDPTCGICDHLNRCAYHLSPREFFRMHPEAKEDWRMQHNVPKDWAKIGSRQVHATSAGVASFGSAGLASITSTCHSERSEESPTDSIGFTTPYEWVQKYHSPRSAFWKWFVSQVATRPGLDPSHAPRLYDDYQLGATQDGAVVFWQIDHEGRARSGKMMSYTADGHRQGHPTWTHIYLQRTGILQPDHWELRQCLFGEHLLTQYPDREVCLVESEKTALVCSLFHPDKLWLATGGCSQLNAEKLRPLLGRKVTVYPDSGSFHKWYAKLVSVEGLDFNIISQYERYPPNTDIADVLLGEALPVE